MVVHKRSNKPYGDRSCNSQLVWPQIGTLNSHWQPSSISHIIINKKKRNIKKIKNASLLLKKNYVSSIFYFFLVLGPRVSSYAVGSAPVAALNNWCPLHVIALTSFTKGAGECIFSLSFLSPHKPQLFSPPVCLFVCKYFPFWKYQLLLQRKMYVLFCWYFLIWNRLQLFFKNSSSFPYII